MNLCRNLSDARPDFKFTTGSTPSAQYQEISALEPSSSAKGNKGTATCKLCALEARAYNCYRAVTDGATVASPHATQLQEAEASAKDRHEAWCRERWRVAHFDRRGVQANEAHGAQRAADGAELSERQRGGLAVAEELLVRLEERARLLDGRLEAEATKLAAAVRALLHVDLVRLDQLGPVVAVVAATEAHLAVDAEELRFLRVPHRKLVGLQGVVTADHGVEQILWHDEWVA
eukprot:CAMPEP_0184394024 /NCGR_PEP_ID=MMETSP0007-20130409/38040_1 /TAXON_ID=97485 /ORGANISM="Prymnesium parvum, Strain Texoma1" /LENGTH=232 /DNA_ID=CAMNT_0026745375 /DNA_START=81 /DNA_END=776 /DNA_ORIENTATION=-